MSPNNALANRDKPSSSSSSSSSSSPEEMKTTTTSRTTVLPPGTVESRGNGVADTEKSGTEISREIQDFLHGDGRFSWDAECRAWFTVWTFLTRLPGPTRYDHHPGFIMRGAAYFPAVGGLIGVFSGVFFDVCHVVLGLPPVVAAGGGAVAAGFWITGCFHEDGLADASDGIGGGWSRRQILTIMTDTRLGTYGCAVLVLYALVKAELLAALGTSAWPAAGGWDDDDVDGDDDGTAASSWSCASGAAPALLATHTVARLAAPVLLHTRDYVDEAGPKQQFYSFMVQAKYLVTRERVAFAIATSGVVLSLLYGIPQATIVVVLVLWASHISGAYGTYILGGVMGDYLGATICVMEILVLVILLALQNKLGPTAAEEGTGQQCLDARYLSAWIRSLVSELSVSTWLEDPWSLRLDSNGPGAVLLRFGLVVVCTTIWCSTVGYPSVVVRDTVVKTQQQDNDKNNDEESTVRIGLATTPGDQQDENAKNPRRVEQEKVQKTLSSPTASWDDKYDAVRQYLDGLAKPVGALGTLEDWAARLATCQETLVDTRVDPAVGLIFAGDHGVARAVSDGGAACSAYPPTVTRAVLVALEEQAAGASVLAKQNNVQLRVIDVGVAGPSFEGKVVRSAAEKIPGGTPNFLNEPALTSDELDRCLTAGRNEVARCVQEQNARVVALGEVGIGNTTSSSALVAAITDTEPKLVCGGGATLGHTPDSEIIKNKVTIVKRALQQHGKGSPKPSTMELLARLGGTEIAALVGAILEAYQRKIPVLVDGFIVTAAALAAAHLEPNCVRTMFFCTQSMEPGQAVALRSIEKIAETNQIRNPCKPALDMDMRLGEGSGAIMGVSILRNASAVLREMATLSEILQK